MYEEEIDDVEYEGGCDSCEWTQARITELSVEIIALEKKLFAESVSGVIKESEELRKLRRCLRGCVAEQMYHQRTLHPAG